MRVDAIILAAGMGTRLEGLGDGAKFGIEVGSVPLIYYPLRSLVLAGVERVYVVVNPLNRSRLEEIVATTGYEHLIRVIVNEEPWRENGYSLLVGGRVVEEDVFLVSMSDHIYPARLPLRLLEVFEENEDATIIVAGDRSPSFIDVEEATLIDVGEGLEVERIGKGLEEWDFVDAGVFLMRKEVIRVAEDIARRRSVVKLSDILNEAVSKGLRVIVADITGVPWTEIDTVEDYLAVNHGWRKVVVEVVRSGWIRVW